MGARFRMANKLISSISWDTTSWTAVLIRHISATGRYEVSVKSLNHWLTAAPATDKCIGSACTQFVGGIVDPLHWLYSSHMQLNMMKVYKLTNTPDLYNFLSNISSAARSSMRFMFTRVSRKMLRLLDTSMIETLISIFRPDSDAHIARKRQQRIFI